MASASKVREWYVVGMSGKVLVSRRGRYRRLLKMPSSLNANFPFIVRLIPPSSKAAREHPTGHSHLSESGSNIW